jgi:iron complex outermembrane receptor protein
MTPLVIRISDMPLRLRTAILLASSCLVASAQAQEQQRDENSIVLEAITVTAQRREQAVKDVPVSLQVFSQSEIEGRIIKRLEDAFAATPNASLTSQRGGNDASSLSVRGVTTTAFGADPSVGVYVDDVYVGNDNGFNVRMGGIEQIEILRGPQGTLYGRARPEFGFHRDRGGYRRAGFRHGQRQCGAWRQCGGTRVRLRRPQRRLAPQRAGRA